MTVLVSLTTRDSVVVGCDSLATTSAPLIPLRDLCEYEFHEPDPDAGTDAWLSVPIGKLPDITLDYPIDHMTHVDKLYSLLHFQSLLSFNKLLHRKRAWY